MAAADDAHPHRPTDHAPNPDAAGDIDVEGHPDQGPPARVHDVHRIADKVKGLLRSDR